MAKLGTLGRDKRGNYPKDIGWELKEDGTAKQHRFYFGKDRSQALIRCLKVESVWAEVNKLWQRDRDGPRPLWGNLSLTVAMSAARGDEVCYLDPADYFQDREEETADSWAITLNADLHAGEAVAEWLARVQADFPCLRLELVDEAKKLRQTEAEKLRRQAAVLRSMAEQAEKKAGPPQGKQKLHQALDAYAVWIGENRQVLHDD